MTPQNILDIANTEVKRIGKIQTIDAMNWMNRCNMELSHLNLVIDTLEIPIVTSEKIYSLANAFGFKDIIELRDENDNEYEAKYRIRYLNGEYKIIFNDYPVKNQTITIWYSKNPFIIDSLTMDMELEIYPDFHDIYLHYIEREFYKSLMQTDLAVLSDNLYQRRLEQLISIVSRRWDSGSAFMVKGVM